MSKVEGFPRNIYIVYGGIGCDLDGVFLDTYDEAVKHSSEWGGNILRYSFDKVVVGMAEPYSIEDCKSRFNG